MLGRASIFMPDEEPQMLQIGPDVGSPRAG